MAPPPERRIVMISREYMLTKLNETTEADFPVICIPSYKRPNFELSKRILPSFSKEALSKVYIFVRQKQIDRYRKANPNYQYVVIPDGAVTGLGTTRQFIIEWASSCRIPFIMDMDDDIKYLQFLFNSRSDKSESLVSSHSTLKDWETDPTLPQRVLQLVGKISRKVFLDHPEVMLGNIRRQRFSNHPECAQIMYQINKGPTPRQTKLLNIRGIYKNKLWMPEEFDLHGEDMGYAAEVLQRGFSCFNIPCLCYDFIDDATNSVVRDWRNPDSAANRALHRAEYTALQGMEVRSYLRESVKFDDGQYKFGDIDWRKYHKLRGTRPITEMWEN